MGSMRGFEVATGSLSISIWQFFALARESIDWCKIGMLAFRALAYESELMFASGVREYQIKDRMWGQRIG